MQHLAWGLPTAEESFRNLMALICQLIYPLIAWFYDLFIYVSQVDILSSKTVQPIYQRVTMILTIVMVFYITFEFVKYVVQPDGIADKEKGAGKLIYKMIAVVVLIAFVPTIFTYAFKFQNVIVHKDIIGKVILGTKSSINDNYGGAFSMKMFSLFYKVEPGYGDKDCDGIPCGVVVNMNLDSLYKDKTLKYLKKGINENTSETVESNGIIGTSKIPNIEFDGLFAVIVGGLIVYILMLYCIDVGRRWAQLVFLQVIAPIPIIGFLSPKKDGIFQKWCKQCITTYLDLFIRIAIINFVLLISNILLDGLTSNELLIGLEGVSGFVRSLVIIVLILGLLLFAQNAPKLLGELFPKMGAASGNFGLKGGERVAPMAARAIGAGLGGATNLLRKGIVSGVNRHRRNRANGQKSIFTKEGRQQRRERLENRKQQREAARDYSNAQTANARRQKYDQKIAEQKKRVQDAKTRLDTLKADSRSSQESIATAEATLKQEAEKYRGLVNKRNGTDRQKTELGQQVQDARRKVTTAQQELEAARNFTGPDREQRIAKAQQELKNAESNLKSATSKYTSHIEKNTKSPTSEIAANLMSTKEKVDLAKRDKSQIDKKVQDAQQELNDKKNANKSPEEILAAEEKLKQAKAEQAKAQENVDAANDELEKQKDRFNTVRTGDTDTTSRNLETANQQVAKDLNERYGSVAGSVIAGALSGAAGGMMTGGKAKKVEEIFPKVKEAWQKDTKAIRANETYLDNGGASGVQGFVNKTVTTIEKGLGVDTAYERTLHSTKPIEKQIKEIDARMDLAKDVTGTISAAEDRAKSKVYDLQTPATERDENGNTVARKIKTGIASINGGYADVTGCATLGDVVRKYDAEAEVAKNEADAATRRLDAARAEAQANGTTISEYDPLVKEVNEKSIKAQQAKYAAEQVKKNAARDEMTQILQYKGNPEAPKEGAKHFDQGTVQKILALRRSLQLAASNPELRARIQQELMKTFPTKAAALYNAFVTDTISSFDDLDDINTVYLNVTSAYERDKRDAAERKREIETGDVAQAQKATQDWAGSGK